MNRRTFLKSAAASAVLAKLGLKLTKPMLLGNLTTDGTGKLVAPAPKFQPYQQMYFDSTPTGDQHPYYQLWLDPGCDRWVIKASDPRWNGMLNREFPTDL